tara:strand:+ start:731 stop:1012 length:282 start_codon:yes stop_codon:yes gene_type:complete
MSKLIIKNKKEFIELKGREIINLEVKLNITEHVKEWKHIGDYLYKFYTLEGCERQPMNILDVTEYQFNYLKDLNSKKYEDVYIENQKSRIQYV